MSLPTSSPADNLGNSDDPADVVALHAEHVGVERRNVEGETVRVAVVTRTREEEVETTLRHERVEVERVAIGRIVDAVPPVRQEGDITVLSVVEEIVVVERHLLLKEEVRVRRVTVSDTHRETMSLHEQTVEVTRTSPG